MLNQTNKQCAEGNHLIEPQYLPHQKRQRVPRFRLGCTECEAESKRVYRLRGYIADEDGYPCKMQNPEAQRFFEPDILGKAADDICEWADGHIDP